MGTHSNNYSNKHSADEAPDPLAKEAIIQKAVNNKLPCAVAFNIAEELDIPVVQIGKTADLMNCKLTKCQLGLFGHTPENKRVTPQDTVDSEIKTAIQKALMDNKLTCENAWKIANSLNVHKMTVSAVCESLKIKINKCQLGAF
jgi:hypothetical protein